MTCSNFRRFFVNLQKPSANGDYYENWEKKRSEAILANGNDEDE